MEERLIRKIEKELILFIDKLVNLGEFKKKKGLLTKSILIIKDIFMRYLC